MGLECEKCLGRLTQPLPSVQSYIVVPWPTDTARVTAVLQSETLGHLSPGFSRQLSPTLLLQTAALSDHNEPKTLMEYDELITFIIVKLLVIMLLCVFL